MRKLHHVFWDTHGCEKTKGHANPCKCNCGVTLPTGHLYVFGSHSDTAVFDPHNHVSRETSKESV